MPNRWLYHWARLFSGRLQRGQPYSALKPVVAIAFLDLKTSAERFHSIHHALEIHSGQRLFDGFELHLIELPRLDSHMAEREPALLVRWARFLSFEDPRELDSLASEDPIMAEAKDALERLSDDPAAQRLAERRREAELEWERFRIADERRNVAKGLAKGLAEGHVQRARLALLDVLAARGFTPTERQRAGVEACDDVDVLARWMRRAVTAESLAAVFDEH